MAVYAVEIRMYSWAFLLLPLGYLCNYRLFKRRQHKKLDYIWNFKFSKYIFTLLWVNGSRANQLDIISIFNNQKRKKGIIFIISFGIVQALAYLPWLVNFVTQLSNVSNGFWIGFSFPKTQWNC